MPNPTPPADEASTHLADEIRASEPLYVAAAVKACRERIGMEYFRLRGYAAESGASTVVLNMQVVLDLVNREVVVHSVPDFVPATHTSRRSVPAPDLNALP